MLDYDPATGKFHWRVTKANKVAGSVAGSISSQGYWELKVDRRLYRAHRLAWFYMTGRWPAETVDHINCVRTDNRFENLREASLSQNNCNTPIRTDNTSGFKGVYWHKQNQKWIATIGHKKKVRYLGSFDTAERAHEAYCLAAVAAFGEYFNGGRAAA